ncbi:MAG: DUF4330 domain-containing protein [Clostridia bacterium]
MKIIDKQMKLFGKISLLDILIVAVAIAIVVAAVLYFGSHGTGLGSADTTPIIYEVMIKKVEMETAMEIKAGDEVKDRVKGYDRGVVISVEAVLHSEKATDLTTGAQRLEEYPGLYDAVVRIRTDAEVTDRYIMLSGNRMDIGKEAYLQIGPSVYKSYVSAIEIIGQEEGR